MFLFLFWHHLKSVTLDLLSIQLGHYSRHFGFIFLVWLCYCYFCMHILFGCFLFYLFINIILYHFLITHIMVCRQFFKLYSKVAIATIHLSFLSLSGRKKCESILRLFMSAITLGVIEMWFNARICLRE